MSGLLVIMLVEPLSRVEALKLARRILEEGYVVLTKHAMSRQGERDPTMVDITNVIQRGFINNEPEQDERRRWAYRIGTPSMAVVVAFTDELEMRIVTAIRKSGP